MVADIDAVASDGVLRALLDQPPATSNYLCNWSKKHRFIYVETPKAACTTIKRVLQQAEVGGGLVWDDPSLVHDRLRSPLLSPESGGIHAFAEAMNSDDCFRFCFVRNPIARAVSCWLDKMIGNEFERRRLAPSLGLDPSSPPPFADFLRAVKYQKDEECDIHWAPQTFLVRPDRIRYSFIGRFESFREHFRRICDYLGISMYAQDLPDVTHMTNASEKVMEHVSKAELELIHAIYERDFRNFGYGWSPEVI